MEGTLGVQVGEERYLMDKDDVIVINANHEHALTEAMGSLVCIIDVDADMLADAMGHAYVTFWCNTVADKNKDHRSIRKSIGDLIMAYSVNMEYLSFKKKSLFFELLDCMENQYVIKSKSKLEMVADDYNLKEILRYINDNYQNKITLTEIAEMAYMNQSTFSRYFKKQVGVNFLEYLNGLRLQKALDDLLNTSNNLTRISLDNGFTNPSMFSKAFKAAYNMPPSEYKRLKKENKVNVSEGNADRNHSRYIEDITRFVSEHEKHSDEKVFVREVTVDTNDYTSYTKVWNKAINIGSASELLSAKLQQHLSILKESLGFSYVRIFNIFAHEMMIREPGEKKTLNFELMNNVLDFIVSNNMKPIFELGSKPKRVLYSADSALYEEAPEVFFQSEEEAQWVLKKFMQHICLRYGIEETEQWIFEVWFDARQYKGNGEGKYFRMFDSISESIRSYVPKVKIGGCGLELGNAFKPFIHEWVSHHYKPDFISIVAFPYKRTLPGYLPKIHGTERSTDFHFFKNELRKRKQQLKESGLGEIGIYLTEWNLSLSDRNYFHDTCGKACLMLMNMIDLLDEIEMGIYWGGSDLNIRAYDTSQMLFGGHGLLSKDALPKPSYYALYFLQRLGQYMVESGEGYIVTTDGNGNYSLLMYNYKKLSWNYYMKEEFEILPSEMPKLFENVDSIGISIELKHVNAGEYIVKTYEIGTDKGSVFDEWREMGESDALNISDLEYLKGICVPHVKVRRQVADQGCMIIHEELNAHDIKFIQIIRNSRDFER